MRRFAPSVEAAALAAAALFAGSAAAEPIYGLTDALLPSLVTFDSATPGSLTTIAPVTGVAAGQALRGIDFRASDGQLYALSSSGTAAQLYTINLATGAATAIGSGITLTGNTSTRISLDFNPVPNALRVVTGSGQSYRVNATTGALIAQDTSVSPNLLTAGVAYTNNVVGATSTTLYGYDFVTDNLFTIGGLGGMPSPNLGQTFVVGNSGQISFSAALGFDISGATGIAYASFDDAFSAGGASEFFTANLATGAFSFAGAFSVALLDISVRPTVVPEPETLAMLGIGLVSLLGLSRRRRKGTAPTA